MNTDERRSRADAGTLEHEISNLILGEVPETAVCSRFSASVFIRVHRWPPIIVQSALIPRLPCRRILDLVTTGIDNDRVMSMCGGWG